MYGRIALACVAAVLASSLSEQPSLAGPRPKLETAFVKLPLSNMPDAGVAVGSDTRLVYALDSPILEPHAGHQTRNFNSNLYMTELSTKTDLRHSKPSLLFRGPQGIQTGVTCLVGDWLTYTEVGQSLFGPWTMLARNVVTGRVVVLDKSTWEGVPSNNPPPYSDGHTVVWQAFKRTSHGSTSIVRSFDLATGRRRVLASGGNASDRNSWAYYGARVSGQWVATQKQWFSQRREQIVLINLKSGRARAITSPRAANSDPSISGDIVTWILGYRAGPRKGIAVYRISRSTKIVIPATWIGLPVATAGRYVVYAHGQPTRIDAYDTMTGKSVVVAAAIRGGYLNSTYPTAGGRTVLFTLAKGCANGVPGGGSHCQFRLTVTRLP